MAVYLVLVVQATSRRSSSSSSYWIWDSHHKVDIYIYIYPGSRCHHIKNDGCFWMMII